MPRHQGITGEQWDKCGRCGFEYPASQLTRQFGLVVCFKTCYDNTDNRREVRDALIAQKLGDGQEGRDELHSEQLTDPGELVF